MSKTVPKFGELALRGIPSSSIDDENEHDDNQTGFSNIDLNATQNYEAVSSNNDSDLGYTSFGHAFTDQKNSSTVSHPDARTFTEPSSPQKIIPNHTQVNPSAKTSLNNNNSTNSNNFSSLLSSNISTASATSMLSSASEASTKLAIKTASTIETLKQWSKSAYKCTRQIVSERLGKSSRTVDPELEASIDNLREVKRKYETVLTLASSLTTNFQNMIQTQKSLGETFADLAQKSSELIDEFTTNSETQRQLVRHGESLLNGLNFFTSSLKTLCYKTMEDTLLTIRNYEAARLEYDAYRFDLESLKSVPINDQKLNEIADLEQNVSGFREKYELLKKDVGIKMKFLDENRIKVMKKQLLLFQSAINSYFAGNQQALESSMKQLNIKQANDSNTKLSGNPDDGSFKFQSFLEQN